LVQNWWLWCKPGDLIVVDEAQFIAPRATLGRKPPYWIQALEIHRHYGVDFLVITQHPGLIDTTIRHLVGMHRHVRSVMGSPVCMVYEWDHAANPERFNLANKTTFVRRAKHYRLFHSSVAHVKPPTSGRSIFVVVPVLLLGVGWGVLHFKHRFSPGVPVASAVAAPLADGRGAVSASSAAASAAYGPQVSIGVPVRGCWAQGDRCECIGDHGRRLFVDRQTCLVSSSGFDGLVQWEPQKGVPYDEQQRQAKPASPASAPAPLMAGAN
jgi:zona occludens toxin